MKIRTIGLLIVILMAAAACGGADAASTEPSVSANGGVASLDDGNDADSDTEPSEELDTEAQLLAFAECVRAQGYDIDDPTIDSDGNVQLPRGERTEGLVEARQACEGHLEGVELGFRGGDQTAQQDQLLAFAACMRDNGFDFPDPDFSSEGGGRGLLQNIDQDDPAYQSAFEACSDLFGGARGGN